MIRLRLINLQTIRPKTKTALLRLTKPDLSNLRSILEGSLGYSGKIIAVTAYDTIQKKYVGWGACHYRDDLNVYVHTRYRRRGIGTRIVKRIAHEYNRNNTDRSVIVTYDTPSGAEFWSAIKPIIHSHFKITLI